jgi:putative flippase GtrA
MMSVIWLIAIVSAAAATIAGMIASFTLAAWLRFRQRKQEGAPI